MTMRKSHVLENENEGVSSSLAKHNFGLEKGGREG